MNFTRRSALTAGALLLALGTGTARVEAQQDWPTDPVTFMVTTPTGGSEDRMVRTLAPFLSEELGVPVVVENVDGAQGILGPNRLLRQGTDGSIIASTTVSRLIGHIESGRTSFSLDDFDFLNAPSEEYAMIISTSAASFDSAEGLIEALEDGEAVPSFADPAGTGPGIMLQMFLEKLEVPDSAYRAVTYTGGGPLIAAIMGGQVDFAPMAEPYLERLENVKPLLIFRDERSEQYPDVPTTNEVLEPYGVTMPAMNTGLRAFLVPATLKQEHPERFDTLTEALRRVYENPEALAAFETAQSGTNWLGPDKSRAVIEQFATDFRSYLVD